MWPSCANGPEKGANLETQQTMKKVKSLQALFQLHRNIKLKPDQQTSVEYIANDGTTADCKGVYVKASVAADARRTPCRSPVRKKVHEFKTR